MCRIFGVDTWRKGFLFQWVRNGSIGSYGPISFVSITFCREAASILTIRFMKIRFLGILYIVTITAAAQSGIVAAGGVADGDAGSATFSIGQIDYGFQQSGTFSVSEGLQQPFEIIPLATAQPRGLQMTLYPNPTASGVRLYLPSGTAGGYSYEVFNGGGQRVGQGKFAVSDGIIPLQAFSPGVYLLRIVLSDGREQTFKIIKHN